MTAQVADVLEERRTSIIEDLRGRLTTMLADHERVTAGITADPLIRECAHVVADLPLVLREGLPVVEQHDHDREMHILRSLGAAALDGKWPTRVLFETHALLRSRIMAHVLKKLPPCVSPAETYEVRAGLYDAIDQLVGYSPCDFMLAVEQRLRAQRDELAWLTRKTLAAQEEERRRIAMNVHDVLSPTVSAAMFRVQAALARLEAGEPGVGGELRAAQEALERCMADMRQVELDLRPPVLDAFGLAAALREYAIRFERQYGLPVSLADGVYERGRLPLGQEAALFRIAQEAMINAARHAQATSLRVRVEADTQAVALEVADDGVGFDVERELGRVVREQHLGLLGMRERTELLEGQLEILSQPGDGTTVSVRVPRPRQEV